MVGAFGRLSPGRCNSRRRRLDMKKHAKRGPKPKASILEQAPSMEAALVEYNAYQDRLDKRLLPAPTRDVFAMSHYRRDQYDAARGEGLDHRDAIDRANRTTAKRFNCTTQTVRNWIGTIDA